MTHVNWLADYNREFACPRCGHIGMRMDGIRSDSEKRRFECPKCYKISTTSVKIKTLPYWYKDYKNGEFACPNLDCNGRDIRVSHRTQKAAGRVKWTLVCQVCGTSTLGRKFR